MAAIIQKGFELIQDVSGDVSGDPMAGVTSVIISQEPDFFECLCPFIGESTNIYKVSSCDERGLLVKQQLGEIFEKTDFCPTVLFQQWRPFKQVFYNLKGQEIFEVKRECRIPSEFCMPCARPELHVKVGDQSVGSVKNPYICCGRGKGFPFPVFEELNIYNSDNQLKYLISGGCCQTSNWARFMYCPFRGSCGCKYITFEIMNPNKEVVGEIKNVFFGCQNEWCSKSDQFICVFPPDASYIEKYLIMAATLVIDFDWFESTCQPWP